MEMLLLLFLYVINILFFTKAAKLKVLARTPCEVGAQA